MDWIRWGSLIAMGGVLLGAFGAHALKATLSPEAKEWYHTAVFYHLVHALALLAVGWLSVLRAGRGSVPVAGWLFLFGILLFSGSLYAMSVTGIRKLGMITPIGGMALVLGWLALAIAAR